VVCVMLNTVRFTAPTGTHARAAFGWVLVAIQGLESDGARDGSVKHRVCEPVRGHDPSFESRTLQGTCATAGDK
jgi:hypothetical protein